MSTSAPSTRLISLLGLDPRTYEPHALHAADRTYREINCYADVLIELLHARGEEPLAAMGATLRMDFEGDQWTFFKPAPQDLEVLYGLDGHEMQPYRPLPQQIAEQIAAGRTLMVEVDSFYLPDTAATSYRAEHVKSSIVAAAIDPGSELLHYFHATGLHELGGEDYRGVFRLGREFSEDVLPPYVELVRFDAGAPLRGDERVAASLELLRAHFAHRPETNPFERFGAQLARELPALLEGDAARFHDYAFATVRQAGSAFEAARSHVAWSIGDRGAKGCAALAQIVEGCKALSFRLARRRAFEPEPAIAELAAAWDEAMVRLDECLF